jgi:hypothetical protein
MRLRSSGAVAASLALVVAGLVAGCGSSHSETGFRSRPAPSASLFPAAGGQTLDRLLSKANGPAQLVLSPAGEVFQVGVNRFPFGVFTTSRGQVTDAQVALYAAHGPKAPASGPYPARIEDLKTPPEFRARTTTLDPNAAQIAYVSDVRFPTKGNWDLIAMIRLGNKLLATRLPTVTRVGEWGVPTVGQKAPVVHTLTATQVGGQLSKIDTRLPPDTMHADDLANVLGKKPVVLIFATPQLCQSRVCGPVVDIAEQVKQNIGDRAVFIHQEVYNDNQVSKGLRPQLVAYHLPSEPWTFVIDRNGVISDVLQGPFSPQELTSAVQKVAGR